MKTVLRGICWDHTRGHVPLVAAGQRFHELNPDVEFLWEKRNLRSFGETNLETLSQTYDLLVMDHPLCGEAVASNCLLPLDGLINPDALAYFKANTIGPAYESYTVEQKQWALPIDVACPVACYRPDLIEKRGLRIPRQWDALLTLAKQERVLLPAIDTDAILHLFALCLQRDGKLFDKTENFATPATISNALTDLKELVDLCPRHCLDSNPIAILQELASGEQFAYCPFAFGYSNYSRIGYAKKRLKATTPPNYQNKPLRTLLGGAGIAVSARTKHAQIAADFAAFCMSTEVQSGLYAFSGGQPGDRAAWENEELNQHTHSFFSDTKEAIDRSYLRPRYNGFIPFQHRSGLTVNRFLRGELSCESTVEEIGEHYRKSPCSKDALS